MTRWHPAPRHECSLQEPDDEREGDEARGLDPLGTLRWRKSWSNNEDGDGEQDDEGSNEDYGIGPSENLKRSWWCNQRSLKSNFCQRLFRERSLLQSPRAGDHQHHHHHLRNHHNHQHRNHHHHHHHLHYHLQHQHHHRCLHSFIHWGHWPTMILIADQPHYDDQETDCADARHRCHLLLRLSPPLQGHLSFLFVFTWPVALPVRAVCLIGNLSRLIVKHILESMFSALIDSMYQLAYSIHPGTNHMGGYIALWDSWAYKYGGKILFPPEILYSHDVNIKAHTVKVRFFGGCQYTLNLNLQDW